MNNWETYIRQHAAELDTAPLPEEAEERFLDRWEAGHARQKSAHGIRRIVLWSAAAAAAVALLVLLRPAAPKDWFRGIDNTPEAVYSSYLAQVEHAWELAGPYEDLSDQLSGLTEETVPMLEQLPEELPAAEQAQILRDYYGALLDGVESILKTNKQ